LYCPLWHAEQAMQTVFWVPPQTLGKVNWNWIWSIQFPLLPLTPVNTLLVFTVSSVPAFDSPYFGDVFLFVINVIELT
jgi:hypothetical protein